MYFGISQASDNTSKGVFILDDDAGDAPSAAGLAAVSAIVDVEPRRIKNAAALRQGLTVLHVVEVRLVVL